MITHLQLRSTLVLALALFAFGCPEEGGDGGSGSGGDGDGDSSCEGVCNALISQGCFYASAQDQSDCQMSCNGYETMYAAVGPDYCMQAWSDYKTCIANESLHCVEDFEPDWETVTCRDHWDHFQNYCVTKNAMPSTPCMPDMPIFDSFCTATPATPHGKSCFGDAPAGCVVGGTENNSNVYCCP